MEVCSSIQDNRCSFKKGDMGIQGQYLGHKVLNVAAEFTIIARRNDPAGMMAGYSSNPLQYFAELFCDD
jgi:hypothetical protein